MMKHQHRIPKPNNDQKLLVPIMILKSHTKNEANKMNPIWRYFILKKQKLIDQDNLRAKT